MDAEQGRLAALHAYDVLDTPADPQLDKITALAAELFDTPNAGITLIDAERAWMKARVGDIAVETPRAMGFCNTTVKVGAGDTLLVEDARLDPAFRDNPFVTAPGGLRFYLGAPLVTRDGHALGALCVFDTRPRSDVSARDRRRLQVLAELVVDELELRRAARQVVEAQRLLSLAESMAGVGHWSLRRRDFHTTWSDEVYRIHGLERDSFNPNLQAGVGFYHPDDQAKVAAAVEQAFATKGHFSFELRLRRADGALRRVAARAMCELDEAGEAVSLFGVFQDVTEQASLVEAANAASNAKSDFLANMSHELRTPLNSIIGFTHVLVRDGDLAPKHRHQLMRIEEAGRGLLTVVNDVLDFSRIESRGVELSPRPFSPVRLMENLVALAHPQAIDKHLSLVVDYPLDRQVLAVGDVDRLRQVLMNLLTNAVKFTVQGEVRLALQTRRRDGRVQLVFQVCDTGIGIAHDQIEGLFHRFNQADGSISRRFGGTGLGLAISKRLVEAMDGTIEVWSELGHGSTFEVRVNLPAAEALAEADLLPAMANPAHGAGPLPAVRVLVAEDVPVNQELVRLMLAPLGCEVVVVGDGEQALDAAAAGGFDLILMDMQMPVLDGLEATRMIRRLGGAASRTPIVALTANVLPEQIERCRRAGMNDHVAKPFVTEDLQSMVLKWANGSGATSASLAPNPVLDDLTAQIGPGPIRGLLASLDAQMVQILSTPLDTDPAFLSRLAHSLRGAAGALGYVEAARACQAVETAQKAGASADGAFTALQAACSAARAALVQRLAA
ncbi:ATP-binding protein [Caulobacter sp. S45]|uniref:hybrid sensor histidine kinase/response regulator n=1 Tax=Caulobacter sp. S45 TaxID=1641861 RepID=UPI001576333F|nr:ATP-binding protein [Caulobacter sp. S45]